MRQSLLVWLTAMIAALAFASCQHRNDDLRDTEEGHKVHVEFEIGLSDPSLELRAGNVNVLSEENTVNSLFLITASDAGVIESVKNITSVATKDTEIRYTYRSSLTQGSNYTLAVIANCPNPTALTSASTIGKNLSELEGKLFGTDNTLPKTPLFMYGKTSVNNVQSSSQIQVKLYRNVVAINIKNNAPNFILHEWYLVHGVTHGFMGKNPELNGQVNIFNSNSISPDDRAYSYPRHGTVNANTSTCVIFKGTFGGVTSFYRVPINRMGNIQELKRNTRYQVTITKVLGVGYSSYEEALNGTADKTVVFTVSDWDNTNSSEIVFFGNYYLGIEKSKFEFDRDQQSETVELITNAPDVIRETALDLVDGTEASWTTTQISKEDGKQYFHAGVFENFGNSEREAMGRIKATGIHTDDLQIAFQIKQSANQGYISDAPGLQITPQRLYTSTNKVFTEYVTITPKLSRSEWRVTGVEYTPNESFISSISVDGNELGSGATLSHFGEGIVKIVTRAGLTSRPRLAKIKVETGEGTMHYTDYIYVYQDFKLDYTITYPNITTPYNTLNGEENTVYDQIKRTKYVIETPLQTFYSVDYPSYEYYVDVTSNVSWRAEIEPQNASKWIHLTNSSFTHFPGYDETTQRMDIIVDENDGKPVINGYYSLDGSSANAKYSYRPARQATIKIIGHGNETGEEVVYHTLPITVYQGGYVRIGDNLWLDRNLKSGYKFSERYAIYANGQLLYDQYKGRHLLYAYANPIGLKTEYYGAYAHSNKELYKISENKYGSDGYFSSGAPQSGHWFAYRYRDKTRLKLPRPQNEFISYNSTLGNDWDISQDPCPPGWKVPRLADWATVAPLFNENQQTYGQPYDSSLDQTLTSKPGAMGVNNSGRFITVPAYPGTNGGPIDWFLPAAGYRMVNANDLLLPGAMGHYKASDRAEGGQPENGAHYYFSTSKFYHFKDNVYASSSVRCIRK